MADVKQIFLEQATWQQLDSEERKPDTAPLRAGTGRHNTRSGDKDSGASPAGRGCRAESPDRTL